MKQFKKTFISTLILVMATGLLYSCASVSSPEDDLARVSSASDGSSSSAVQGISSGGSSQNGLVFCDLGGGDCREFSYEACLVFGQVVDFCPGIALSSSSSALPSSGSLVPSSSSSLPSGTVLCEYSGICSPVSAEVCALLGGTSLQFCPESSSSALPSSSSAVPSSSSETLPPETFRTFEDSRDGQTYKWVKIGEQIWMAENLNYNAINSKCYNNLDNNCVTYGRMYNWATAMNGAASSTTDPSGVQGVCPNDWHLPSWAEWETLVAAVGGTSTAGTKLKATSFGGTDDYGFSALSGGIGYSFGSFNDVGSTGNWWSTSKSGSHYACNQSKGCYLEEAGWATDNYLVSVRCLKD